MLHLARCAASVTVLVRSSSLAESMSRYLIDEMAAAPDVSIPHGMEVVGGGGVAVSRVHRHLAERRRSGRGGAARRGSARRPTG